MLAELLAFFRGDFPDGHPYGSVTAVPGEGSMPNIYTPTDSGRTAGFAGELRNR
jgi:hypothetical protein